jgi:ferredoxin
MNMTVVLCRDGLGDAGLVDASISPATTADTTTTIVIDDLCGHPERIEAAVTGSDRLVLGLCEGRYSLGAIQAVTRRAGLDPLGIELIDLTRLDGDTHRLDTELRARIARADAFTGSSPANAKISMPQRVSRRELLHGLPHEYRSAPTIDPSLCAAESGCRACIDICPQRALSVQDRTVHHDRSLCEPCGLCVTTCPTGATITPATTAAQLQAEITALLDPSVGAEEARGIVFTCSRGSYVTLPTGWYPVTLPCVAMATPGWMLAPLLMGAGSVAAIPCLQAGCVLGNDARTELAVDFCRELLRSVGESPARVSVRPTPDLPERMPRAQVTDPFGPHGAIGVIQALAQGLDRPEDLVLDHPAAPTGVVVTNAASCTRCTMCAQACPTGALASEDSDDRVMISFEAGICTACKQCLSVCPELERGAISLESRVDLLALSRGRITLIDANTIRCESCGRPIAPAPMLERITEMLGPRQEGIRHMITTRCVDCRGVTT